MRTRTRVGGVRARGARCGEETAARRLPNARWHAIGANMSL